MNSVKQPDNGYNELGVCYLESLNSLKHANGASDKVTVSIFAWAEDITLAVPTSKDANGLTPQSGDEVDEANMTGVVSGPATAISKAASALKDVPVIGKYALATSMAAGMTAKVAKALGYCRPPVNKNPEPFRSFPTSSLALTNVPDNAQKLTVDDKQELSIDPRIAGLSGDDPLSIKTIGKIESYLTGFDWQVGSAPGTLLWNGRVDPCTFAYDGVSKFHFPACCMAALPFKYWTGTMNFRFQIMASAYHKGRLKISYDPNWANDEEFNTMYTRIVDLANETDFTISISNGQDVTLLTHHLPGVDAVTQMYSTSRYLSKEEGNGVVAVSILNELTTPNSTTNNDVTINVFVSMGDDFEVYVPDEHFAYFTYRPVVGVMAAQSGEEIVPDSFAQQQDQPEHDKGESIGPTVDNLDKVSLVYW